HPIPCIQFLHGRRQVVPNRPLRKRQLHRNGVETGPRKRHRKDLTLPSSERILSFRKGQQSELGINHTRTFHHPPERTRQFCSRRIFEQKTNGPTLHRPAQIAAASKGGQDHTAAPWQGYLQGLCCRESIQTRHFDVQQCNIWLRCYSGLHDLIPSRHLGDDVDIRFSAQQSHKRSTHHCLVFCYQHSDHRHSF